MISSIGDASRSGSHSWELSLRRMLHVRWKQLPHAHMLLRSHGSKPLPMLGRRLTACTNRTSLSACFGCDAKDSLEHYIICRLLWSVLDCAFGGNLNPNLFARVNYSAPSSMQCCLIATAFEIYHALKIGQRALVDTALSCRRFAPIITVAELIAADCARKVGNLDSESDSSSTSSSSVSSDVSA